MKRLMMLIAVGLLAACGGMDDPEVPLTCYMALVQTPNDGEQLAKVCYPRIKDNEPCSPGTPHCHP